MERTITIVCMTRRFEGDEAIRTELTLDYSLCTQEDINAMADDSAVIKWQSASRRAAMKKENAVPIPTKATYVVPKPGTRASGETSEYNAIVKFAGKEKADAMIAKSDVHTVFLKLKAVLEEME